MRLAATIITFNEEARIADCIASVHEWCDEVLVLDSNSTDKTREIAVRFKKVRFLTHQFDGHVQQKNRAIELADADWVFCLDADERATKELAAAVQEFIAEHPGANGARVNRLTYHLGRFIRHGGWYNARYRLLRKGHGGWTGENPHDYILPEGVKRPTSGPVLKGDLIHYSFRDLSHQVETINAFSSIVAFTRAARGKKPSFAKMLIKPYIKFLEMYIFKLGFLDGVPGLVIAISSAYSTFLKFAKLYELRRWGIERPSNLRDDYKPQ